MMGVKNVEWILKYAFVTTAAVALASCGSEAAPQGDVGTSGGELNDVGGVELNDVGGVELNDVGEDVVCGDPDVWLRQHQLEQLEGCDVYRGSITFADYPGEDLSAVPPLRVIEGTFNLFRNPNLKSAQGLETLEQVGNLSIHLTDVFDDLSALGNLRRIDGEFMVSGNQGLTHFAGLESLRFAGSLRIEGNMNLASLSGLEGLQEVADEIAISNNPMLSEEEIREFRERLEAAEASE